MTKLKKMIGVFVFGWVLLGVAGVQSQAGPPLPCGSNGCAVEQAK